MTYILLTGAGFSCNWGGWLADEAFEYLLGCAEVKSVVNVWRNCGFDKLPRYFFDERYRRAVFGLGLTDKINSDLIVVSHQLAF
jgi:hypothetical protein